MCFASIINVILIQRFSSSIQIENEKVWDSLPEGNIFLDYEHYTFEKSDLFKQLECCGWRKEKSEEWDTTCAFYDFLYETITPYCESLVNEEVNRMKKIPSIASFLLTGLSVLYLLTTIYYAFRNSCGAKLKGIRQEELFDV